MAELEPPSEEGGDVAPYKGVLTGGFLIEWVKAAASEFSLRDPSLEESYRVLQQLWAWLHVQAQARLEIDKQDVPALAFLAEWDRLSRRWGDPVANGWKMTGEPALRRLMALYRYMRRTNQLKEAESQTDTGEDYLAKLELEASR